MFLVISAKLRLFRLVGRGTKYIEWRCSDYEGAKIDGGKDNPGYFRVAEGDK